MPLARRNKIVIAAIMDKIRRLLRRQDRKPFFAGRFFRDGTKIIQTARTAPRRRQKVKPRRRIVVAKKQKIFQVVFSSIKLSVLAAGAAIFILHMLHYLSTSPKFAIDHIGVNGNMSVTAQAVIDSSGLHEGRNIFHIHLSDAAAAIAGIPRVQSAVVRRKLPNEIQIEITERQPAALVLAKEILILDKEAKVIEQFSASEDIDAPIITGRELAGLAVGDVVQVEGISQALQLIDIMKELEISESLRISEINIDDPENIVMVAGQSGATIYLGSGDYRDKLWRLVQVNDEIGKNNRLQLATLERVDMRFESIIPAKFSGG